MGMKEMRALLERWRMDEAEVRRRMYRAPDATGARAVARGLAVGAGLGRQPASGGGAGTRCPYYWPIGQGIRRGWSQGAGF